MENNDQHNQLWNQSTNKAACGWGTKGSPATKQPIKQAQTQQETV